MSDVSTPDPRDRFPELIPAPRPNRDVPLGAAEALFRRGDRILAADADITIKLLPGPRVAISSTVEVDAIPPGDGFSINPLQAEVPSYFLSGEWTVTRTSFDLIGRGSVPLDADLVRATPHPSSGTEFVCVEFYLINYDEYRAQVTDEQGAHTGRFTLGLDLRADGWEIAIDAQRDISTIVRELRPQGGFRITHRGLITRADGAPFSHAEVDDLLRALYYFLSFARGMWSGPVLPSGFDSAGDRTWIAWSFPYVSRWQVVDRWCDRVNAQMLGDAFPGFLRLWRGEAWGEAIQRIVYWYVSSNLSAAGVEGSTILSLTGLDLIAWVWLTQARGVMSVDGFKRISSADRLRLVLTQAGIDLAVPESLPALASLAGSLSPMTDGPEAIAQLRNGYVHPGEKPKLMASIKVEAKAEAWKLSLWYFELLLLFLCGYDGPYSNRLRPRFVGELDPAPWASPEAKAVRRA